MLERFPRSTLERKAKYVLQQLFHQIGIWIGHDEQRSVQEKPACGAGPSSPPWHPYLSMELATVAPHAQPKTHQNRQKAKSYTLLAH